MQRPNDILRDYLRFFQDLGIDTIYRRPAEAASKEATIGLPPASEPAPVVMASPPQPPTPPPPVASLFQEPVAPPTAEPPRETLPMIRQDIGDCTRCRLHEGRTKIVFGSGPDTARLVFVGEGPGADEDSTGDPFVGRAGQLLTQMIDNTAAKEGIPLRRADCYICNVVKCRPPENRTPERDEADTCGQFLVRQLEVIRPKAILCLGGTAAKFLLDTKDGITKLRGHWHEWRGIPVMATWHPSYLLRPYNQNAKREAWEDLKRVLHYIHHDVR